MSKLQDLAALMRDSSNEEKEVMIGLRSQSVRRQDKRRGREKDVDLSSPSIRIRQTQIACPPPSHLIIPPLSGYNTQPHNYSGSTNSLEVYNGNVQM